MSNRHFHICFSPLFWSLTLRKYREQYGGYLIVRQSVFFRVPGSREDGTDSHTVVFLYP